MIFCTLATAFIALSGVLKTATGNDLAVPWLPASFGVMAAPTGWHLLLLATLQFLLLRGAGRRWAVLVPLGFAALSSAAFLLLVILSLPDKSNLDSWMFGQAPVLARWQLPLMTPMTAAQMLLSVLGLFAVTLPAERHHLRRLLGYTGTFPVLAACLFNLSVQSVGAVEMLIGTRYGPSAYWASAALALLNFATALRLGLRWDCIQFLLGREPGDSSDPRSRSAERWILAGMATVALATAVLLGIYVREQVRQARTEAEVNLTAIAELKAQNLKVWWHERLGDAGILRQLPISAGFATRADGDVNLRTFLESYRRTYSYRQVAVLDRDCRPVLSLPSEIPFEVHLSPTSVRALPRREGVAIDDLHRLTDGTTCIDLITPFMPEGAGAGYFLLRVDVERQLYPITQTWPSPSETGEILLVRRRGDEIEYLNELRFSPDSALKLTRSFASQGLVSAQALRDSPPGLITGVDYRGVSVLAVTRRVPGSDWMVLAKMDSVEAFQAFRLELLQISGGAGLLLLLLGVVVSLTWRQRQRGLQVEKLRAEKQRIEVSERLGLVMQHANDVILLFDSAMRIIEASDRCREVYGLTPEEMTRLSAPDLRAPDTKADAALQFQQARAADGYVFETMHIRKDGTPFPVEVSTRRVLAGGEERILSIIRDISERKQQEREIMRLNRLYQVISQVDQTMIRAKSREELFSEICRVLVEYGGFQISWVGWLNPASGLIEPVAVAGDEHGYVQGLRISHDASVPEGRGPSGTAFREGRTYVCNDYWHDPGTVPWRQRAEQSGFKSTIALPLREDGRTRGLITVYSRETDYFGPHEVKLLEDAAGDMSFALDVFLKETRRRHAEETLKEREELLSTIVGQALDAIVLVDCDTGRFVEFNTSAHEGLGYTREDFSRLSIQDIQADHTPDQIQANIARITGGVGVSFETRHRHRSGSHRDMMVRARGIRVRGHDYICAVWSDITESHRLLAELRSSEELHRALFENMELGVIYQDAAGVVTAVNPAACRILGLGQAELRGASPTDSHWRFLRDDGAPLPGEEHPSLVALRTGRRISDTVVGLVQARTEQRRWLLINSVPEFRAGEARPHRVFSVFADITERRSTQEELRKLSLAVEQNPASVVITDLAGDIEYVNARFTELTGYTLEEVRGENPRVLKSGQNPPGVYTEMWRTITAGGTWRGELVNRKKNGELHTELVVISPVTDASGRPTHYVAMKEDITQRKLAEAQLQKLSRAVEQSPTSIVITDLTGAIEYANPWFTKTTGYTLEEAKGQNPRILQSGLTPPDTYPQMWATLTAGMVWRGELVNRKKNGEIYVELAVIAPVVDAAGRATHYVAVKEDITERKRTEAALRESEERYRLIADNTDDIIWLYDLSQERYLYSSPSVRRVLGYSPEQLLGMTVQDSVAPASRSRVGRLLAEHTAAVMAGDQSARTLTTEVELVRADGSTAPAEVQATLLADTAGRPTRMLGISRDITERRRTEAAIRESEQRFRDLFDLGSDTIFLLEADTGRIIQANRAAGKMYGYTVAELLTMRNVDLSAEPEQTLLTAREEHPDPEAVLFVPHRLHRRKDGSVFLVEISIRFFTREGKRYYLAAVRDITERAKAAEALRRSEELYRLIADNTSDAIWIYDLGQQQFTYFSPATQRLLGYSPEEMAGKPLMWMLTPESAARATTTIRARITAFDAGDESVRNHVILLDHLHRDGRRLKGEVVTTLLADASGRAAQILGVTRDVTERERAAAALRESLDQLARAEHIAHLGNWVLDLATGEVTWSREMYNLLELDPESVRPSQAGFTRFMPPEEQSKLDQLFAESLANHHRFVLEHRLLMPDGRVKYVEGSGEILYAADGTPLRAYGTVQDVTERKLVEIELHELVKGFRCLHVVSQALERRDIPRNTLMDILLESLPSAMAHPQDTQVSIELDGSRRTGGAPGALQAEIALPIVINDRPAGRLTVGYVRPHLATGDRPFFVREQELIENIARMVGLGLGEQEAFAAVRQFNAELEQKVSLRTQELAARNREFQALLLSIPDNVLRLNLRGEVLNCQRAKDSAAPFVVRDEVAVNLAGCVDGTLVRPILEAGAQALSRVGTVVTEVSLGGAAGAAVEIRAAAIGEDEFVVFIRDITARKRHEAEAAGMLERERQLSEMKSRFISVTSHEFRTPMAAAVGSAELLHNHYERLAPAKREELFARIFGSMRRMTEMLDDILTLSRIEAGRMKRRLVPVDLRKYLPSLVDEIRLGDREAHLFVYEADGGEAQLQSDPAFLHQILANLLSNAARYSPAGTTVTTRLTIAPDRMTVTVADQGIGIPEADLARIFEPFERGSNVGTIKGTGLGLNIVKRMTDLLGGTITVTSALNQGTTFTVTLPRQPGEIS